MSVKFNKIILLCIIMLFCALNTIEAQTKYYTYQNNFGVLNKHRLSIKNSTLLHRNDSAKKKFNIVEVADFDGNLSCMLRIANKRNKEGRKIKVYDFEGNKLVLDKTEWGLVWNYIDDNNYYALRLSCHNSALYDVLDKRTMKCDVICVTGGKYKQISTIEFEKGVNLYDGLNTIKFDCVDNRVMLSIGDKKLQPINNESLYSNNVFNIGYFVGSGAEVAIERLVLKTDSNVSKQVKTNWNKEAIEKYLSNGKIDFVEGIWTYLDRNIDEKTIKLGGKYKLAVVKNNIGGYDLLYYDGAVVNASAWTCGMLKGRLTKTKFKDNYDLVWWDSVMEQFDDDTYASIADFQILTLIFPTENAQIRFVKQ